MLTRMGFSVARSLSKQMNSPAVTEPSTAYQPVAPFIDGALCESASESTVDVVNPSNGRRAFTIPAGCPTDAERAVASARRAFEDGRWSEASPSFRKQTLHHLADLVTGAASVLDELDAADMGKPVREPFGSARVAAQLLRFYAEAVDKVLGDCYVSDAKSLVAQRRAPRGVVVAVVPWNFPSYNALLKVAPALAAGNCVVLKPSELSPRSAMRIAQLAIVAGVPPGVLNVVPGLGESVGRALGLHADVNMLTFTGSTDVGKLMLQYAGQSNMKVVMTECGGKSPHIVFDDGVNLEEVAEAIGSMLLINQGQLCSVGSRLLVQRAVEAALLDRIVARVGKITIGDALDAQTTFGPVASARQYQRILRYVESARASGGQVIAGGKRELIESGGYFISPTIVRDVSPNAPIAREEVFGPVLAVSAFDSEREAVSMANCTPYGLAAYVWTSNLSTGMRMAKAVRSTVWVNAAANPGEGAGHAASFEPMGHSGIGVEGGLAGLESYMRRQLVWINHA